MKEAYRRLVFGLSGALLAGFSLLYLSHFVAMESLGRSLVVWEPNDWVRRGEMVLMLLCAVLLNSYEGFRVSSRRGVVPGVFWVVAGVVVACLRCGGVCVVGSAVESLRNYFIVRLS